MKAIETAAADLERQIKRVDAEIHRLEGEKRRLRDAKRALRGDATDTKAAKPPAPPKRRLTAAERSAVVSASWATRRAKYGPSGFHTGNGQHPNAEREAVVKPGEGVAEGRLRA